MKFRYWFLAVRPKTLTAGIMPVVIGSALAQAVQGFIEWPCFWFAGISALWIQIGTNLINDALDSKTGLDSQQRLGPKRMTQSGLLSFHQVFYVGVGFLLCACFTGLPLVYRGGFPILMIGIVSVLSGYCYTGGPYPLVSLGLGEVFVWIFFGCIPVMGVYYLHTGLWTFLSGIAGAQVGFLATGLIAINHFRDQYTDRKGNRRTLVVRLGEKFGRMEMALLCFLPFLGGFFWWQEKFYAAALLPFVLLPFAVSLVCKLQRSEISPVYNHYLARAALLHFLFSVLLSVGILFNH